MIKKFKHRFYIEELLFESVKLTKNADPDKYKYSSYSIVSYSCSEFSFTWKHGKKMSLLLKLIWADILTSGHIDNILILGLDDTKKTVHNVIILIKSVANKNKSDYCYNIFLEKGLYKYKFNTKFF